MWFGLLFDRHTHITSQTSAPSYLLFIIKRRFRSKKEEHLCISTELSFKLNPTRLSFSTRIVPTCIDEAFSVNRFAFHLRQQTVIDLLVLVVNSVLLVVPVTIGLCSKL